jgi:hypothetical protein
MKIETTTTYTLTKSEYDELYDLLEKIDFENDFCSTDRSDELIRTSVKKCKSILTPVMFKKKIDLNDF